MPVCCAWERQHKWQESWLVTRVANAGGCENKIGREELCDRLGKKRLARNVKIAHKSVSKSRFGYRNLSSVFANRPQTHLTVDRAGAASHPSEMAFRQRRNCVTEKSCLCVARDRVEFGFRLCELVSAAIRSRAALCGRGSRQNLQSFERHAGHSDQENWSDAISGVCHA